LEILYLKIEKEKIGFFKFLLEGYDGLCTQTTVDAGQGKIKLIVPESRSNELRAVINNLTRQLNIR